MSKEEGYPLEAVILVNTKLGDMWKVVEETRKIPDVKFAKAVAGRYDVVAHVKTSNLSWIIARIHGINGVTKTETLITLEAKF
jgi:DNA-binding Lrp family transcriptional regulator